MFDTGRIKRRLWHFLLRRSDAAGLLEKSERLLLKTAAAAIRDVPHYRRMGLPSRFDSIAEFRSRFPLQDKSSTFLAAPITDLCRGGQLPDLASMVTSSGHSGKFAYGLIDRRLSKRLPEAIDFGLDLAFGIDRRKTLVVNCLPMGVRVHAHAATVAEVSVREDMAMALIRTFRDAYDQIVIVTDPLFAKRLVDHARETGFDWSALRVNFVIGEETFAETFRDYLGRCCHIDPDNPEGGLIASSMGTGELGLNLFFEMRETIALRRLCRHDRNCRRQLFAHEGKTVPMLFVYDPLRCHVEIVEPDANGIGEIAVSLLGNRHPLPLLRYRTGDIGRLIEPALGRHLVTRHIGPGAVPPLPMIAVYGRDRDRVNEHHDLLDFKAALYRDAALADHCSGAFRIDSEGGRTIVHIQLIRGCQPSAELEKQAAAAFNGIAWPCLHEHDTFPYGQGLDYERKFTYWDPQNHHPRQTHARRAV